MLTVITGGAGFIGSHVAEVFVKRGYEVLILDESTANLDDDSKELIIDIIEKNNITIINSTHDSNMFTSVDYHYNIKINEDKRVVEEIK